MYRKLTLLVCFFMLSMLVSASGISAQESDPQDPTGYLASPLATTFTYQGRLKDASGPVDDYCDLEFKLFASSGGSDQIGSGVYRNNIPVEDGYFTVNDLDFGAEAFQGEARWLEIAVRCPTGIGDFELLTPRQALTATPQALYANQVAWSGLTGIPAGFTDGVDNDTHYSAGTGLNMSSNQFSVDTSLIQTRVNQSCSAGSAIRVINSDGTVSCESDENTTYSAGTGLTLVGTQFRISFAGNGSASTAARSDHNHWGQTWNGTSGTGLTIQGGGSGLSSNGSVYGVQAYGGSIGVYAESSSDTGFAVIGQGYDFSGRGGIVQPVGVYGDTYSGMGVAGISTDGTGVFGSTVNGVGVYGEAFSTGGINEGVLGVSYSTSGRGVVGNATAASGTTYGVIGYSDSPDGYAGYFRNTSSGVGMYALTDSGSGNIIEAWSSFSDLEFRVERGGDVHADGSFTGGGADYAELLPGSLGLEPGDVLVIGSDGQLVRSTQPYQTNVAGIYSTRPGFMAGGGDEYDGLSFKVPLAVMGIVPVKATTENGPIQPGDLLTTSSRAGYAMRVGADPQVGTIIGKAMEPLAGGTGVIQMLVVLQ